MQTAKLFWSGRSQAVRLPKDFRFSGDQVRVRRHGNTVILEPIAEGWGWLDAVTGQLDEDVLEAAASQPTLRERKELSELFPE
jgi:antitoxin VapB